MTEITVPLSVALPVVLFLGGALWWIVQRHYSAVDKKVDSFIKACCDCRLGVNEEIQDKVDWHSFHTHEHDSRGRVTR